MSESRAPYSTNDKRMAELLRVLTPEQLGILILELSVIVEHGYGELTIKVQGNSIYFLPARSIDGGKLLTSNSNGV
jgi:hypothetical protein